MKRFLLLPDIFIHMFDESSKCFPPAELIHLHRFILFYFFSFALIPHTTLTLFAKQFIFDFSVCLPLQIKAWEEAEIDKPMEIDEIRVDPSPFQLVERTSLHKVSAVVCDE